MPLRGAVRLFDIDPFCREFSERTIDPVTSDDAFSSLNRLADGNRSYTKRVRYSQLFCFFNFVRNKIEAESENPYDTLMIRNLYRQKVTSRWEIIEKEAIDEIIFRTTINRNRLLLELIARGGMRVGQMLNLRSEDLQDQKLTLQARKNGKELKIVFIAQKVADRLPNNSMVESSGYSNIFKWMVAKQKWSRFIWMNPFFGEPVFSSQRMNT